MRKYVSHKHKQRYGCTSKISFLQMSVLLKVKNESAPPKRLQSSRRLPILSWHRERMHLPGPTTHPIPPNYILSKNYFQQPICNFFVKLTNVNFSPIFT